MSLSPEQSAAVANWVQEGASLSDVQKRIDEEFKISMTYMDVRFLVDDLDLTLQDRVPPADASDVTKAAPPPAGGTAPTEPEGAVPAAGGVSIEVDHAALNPGAIISGSVTFSDGVTGKWIVDHQGRPGFTEISQEGYRPSPEDSESFLQELNGVLRSKGMA